MLGRDIGRGRMSKECQRKKYPFPYIFLTTFPSFLLFFLPFLSLSTNFNVILFLPFNKLLPQFSAPNLPLLLIQYSLFSLFIPAPLPPPPLFFFITNLPEILFLPFNKLLPQSSTSPKLPLKLTPQLLQLHRSLPFYIT